MTAPRMAMLSAASSRAAGCLVGRRSLLFVPRKPISKKSRMVCKKSLSVSVQGFQRYRLHKTVVKLDSFIDFLKKDAWIHTRDSRNIAKVLPPSAETILQNCELCITIHDIEMFHYGKELAHESIHVSWIDSFSLNLWLKKPKWIDSQFLRVRIDSALLPPLGSFMSANIRHLRRLSPRFGSFGHRPCLAKSDCKHP